MSAGHWLLHCNEEERKRDVVVSRASSQPSVLTTSMWNYSGTATGIRRREILRQLTSHANYACRCLRPMVFAMPPKKIAGLPTCLPASRTNTDSTQPAD